MGAHATHKRWIHERGGVLFVNCGSIGEPKDESGLPGEYDEKLLVAA